MAERQVQRVARKRALRANHWAVPVLPFSGQCALYNISAPNVPGGFVAVVPNMTDNDKADLRDLLSDNLSWPELQRSRSNLIPKKQRLLAAIRAGASGFTITSLQPRVLGAFVCLEDAFEFFEVKLNRTGTFQLWHGTHVMLKVGLDGSRKLAGTGSIESMALHINGANSPNSWLLTPNSSR